MSNRTYVTGGNVTANHIGVITTPRLKTRVDKTANIFMLTGILLAAIAYYAAHLTYTPQTTPLFWAFTSAYIIGAAVFLTGFMIHTYRN